MVLVTRGSELGFFLIALLLLNFGVVCVDGGVWKLSLAKTSSSLLETEVKSSVIASLFSANNRRGRKAS